MGSGAFSEVDSSVVATVSAYLHASFLARDNEVERPRWEILTIFPCFPFGIGAGDNRCGGLIEMDPEQGSELDKVRLGDGVAL